MAPNSTGSVRDMFTGRDQPVLRCAVYSRLSVANAEKDLTPCDVQRERFEVYVRAMQYEGWQLLDERFDDLGVSGAELSRPGPDPRTTSDRRSRVLLEHLRPSWDSWSRAERNPMVRDLVWSIRCSPRRGLPGFTLDSIAIDNFIEQGGERFADLPPRNSGGDT